MSVNHCCVINVFNRPIVVPETPALEPNPIAPWENVMAIDEHNAEREQKKKVS